MPVARQRERFERADAWLKSLIRPDGGDWSLIGQPWEEKLRRHQARQDSTLEFLRFIGSPHRGLKSIVVVGTAGKGTVTNMIVSLLRSTGASVADHTSPYLQVPMEKMRLNGVPISGSEFADCVEELRAYHRRWTEAGHDLRYGQAWAALVMLWMARTRADWCVYEASVGGRFSNAALLNPDVAVLTNIGLDHLETLGPTIEQIGWHKAGIAERAAHLVTTEKSELGLSQVRAACRTHGTELRHGAWRRGEAGEVSVRAGDAWVSLGRGVVDHQADNAAAAAAAVSSLAERHQFQVPERSIRELAQVRELPGRFELVSGAPRVILDGAHNADKVRALVARFQREFPGEKATIAFGALAAKSPESLLHCLVPIASQFVMLEPRVVGKPATPAGELARLAAELSAVPAVVPENSSSAVSEWLAGADPSETLIVTGSMYLVGEVRALWHDVGSMI